MSTNKNSFGYLGLDYQYKLLAQIVLDKKFANNILTILKPNYFDNEHLKIISSELINAFQNDQVILDYKSLEYRLLSKITNEVQVKFIKDNLNNVKNSDSIDLFNVQRVAIRFCKQQETRQVISEIQKIIDKGDLDDYDQIEEKLKKALEIGENDDDCVDDFNDIDELLSDDFRDPIPTGIDKLDEIMNGGLARGELGIILAALGVGKTTLATKIGNTAFNLGLNVLQIFFEDTPKIIKRKHCSCWTGIELNELPNNRDEVKRIVQEKIASSSGSLTLKRFSSIDTNMIKIRNYVRKLAANGKKPDVILLDYIDCVQPSRSHSDPNLAEAMIMREFENLLYELDIAGWAFTQGNRSAITSEMVDTNQMGGSIKKAQIGHFILSVARPLEQKENNKATLAILKSRFGKDGIIFKNVEFNNGTLQIVIPDDEAFKTIMQTKHDSDISSQERIQLIVQELRKNRDK